MSELVGLIPAAGRGIRAYPYTESLPKCLLEVDGVPLLRRNVELMRDQLGIREVVIVVGHHSDRLRAYLGDGEWLGVQVRYIENDRLERELIYSVYLAARVIDGPCCMLLSDEFYLGSNHRELLAAPRGDALATLGFIEDAPARQIRKNYTAVIEGGRVLSLVEKPKRFVEHWLGVGTYLLQPEALMRLRAAFESQPEEAWPRDFTTWLGSLAGDGGVRAFRIEGAYVNVNDREALNQANLLARDADFEQRSASMVFLVDDAEDDIEEPVRKFAERPELDEILVCARRSSDALRAVETHPKVSVRVWPEPDVSLGVLLRDGLDAAHGDILVIGYSDDSFSPRDLAKLLVYLRDADMVVGTRTTRQMIEQGANMRGLTRTVHIVLAKVMELMWWRLDSRFTDMGCAYRAFWRSTYQTIRGELTSTGVEILPEMVIEVLRARRRIIEIPVNYTAHESDYVPSPYSTVGTFLRVVGLMLRKRFFARLGRRPAPLPAREERHV